MAYLPDKPSRVQSLRNRNKIRWLCSSPTGHWPCYRRPTLIHQRTRWNPYFRGTTWFVRGVFNSANLRLSVIDIKQNDRLVPLTAMRYNLSDRNRQNCRAPTYSTSLLLDRTLIQITDSFPWYYIQLPGGNNSNPSCLFYHSSFCTS